MRTLALSLLSTLLAGLPALAAADQKGSVRPDVLALVEKDLARLAKQAKAEPGPDYPRPSSEVAFLLLTGLAARGAEVKQAAEELRQLGVTPSPKAKVQVFTV